MLDGLERGSHRRHAGTVERIFLEASLDHEERKGDMRWKGSGSEFRIALLVSNAVSP